MTWHWSYKSLPELVGLPDDGKARVWERARIAAGRHWLPWSARFADPAVRLVGQLALLDRRPFPVHLFWFPPLLLVLVAAWAAGRLADQVLLHAARPFILRELPGRCRGCGYDLTGNASGACPECGRPAGEGTR